MHILIIYAHPHHCSFNAALKEHIVSVLNQRQCKVTLSNLYDMQFKALADWNDFKKSDLSPQYNVAQQQAYSNNVLSNDIKHEQMKLLEADAIIFQFPFWWFSVPAILKGWLDRILAPGFAYEKDQWFDKGLLRPRKAMLALTTQSPESAYTEKGLHGNIEQFLLPIRHTLKFVGLTVVSPFIAYNVMAAEKTLRQQYLPQYEQAVLHNLIEPPL